MQKSLLLELFVIITQSAYAQMLPNQALKLNIGRSKLGTGDIQGLMLGVEYEKYFQRKLSWSAELGMTIHDGSDLLLVTEATGETHDLSYRYTTAGAQLAGKIGYHFCAQKTGTLVFELEDFFATNPPLFRITELRYFRLQQVYHYLYLSMSTPILKKLIPLERSHNFSSAIRSGKK